VASLTEALEEALRAAPAALLYLVPAFANPTGTTLSPARQLAVVEVAARYGVRVVADEVYRLTGFEADASGALQAPRAAQPRRTRRRSGC
jgi:2-aminoadipate transaminase